MLAYRQAFASSVVKKYLTLFKHKCGGDASCIGSNSLIFQYAPLTSGEYDVSLFVS